MTPSEIREMTYTELIEALAEAKEEKFNLRFQLATNQLDNHARIKAVKQDIARILTVLHERELASVDAAAGTEERA
ncbi:MAG: 50S ribosomal protein L29 [Acidimicrobiia bacterium]